MIKYIEKDTSVVFSEIPDEITMAVNISNCQNKCVGCHSPYLREDIGTELTNDEIKNLIEKNDGITCFCFMGEGNDQEGLFSAARFIRENYPNLKTAVYSGRDSVEKDFYTVFNYIKMGPYKEEYGPLNKKTTNQRLIEVNHDKGIGSSWFIRDITHKFWK